MNQYDKKMREWHAIRHMEDLFKQGMFSNMKFDNKSEEFNKMFHSSFSNRVTVEQLYDKKEAGTQVIKSIKFKFPIFYDGEFTDTIFRDKEVTVESIVCLVK